MPEPHATTTPEDRGIQVEKPKRPRTKASSVTRQKILSAAIEIIAQTGFEGFSMRALGDRLGVTQMMPYRHFASKEDLFIEIKRLVFDRFGEHLEESAKGGRTPESKLRRLCLGYIRFGCEAPADYQLIFNRWNESIYHAVLKADGRESLTMTRSWMAMLVAVANMRKSTPHDPDVVYVSHLLWEALHGLVSLHVSKKLGFGLTIEDLTEFVVENLMKIASEENLPTRSPIRMTATPTVRAVISSSSDE